MTIGLGTGILVEYTNGLPAAEQAVVADAIQDYNKNALVGDPASVSLLLGLFGWVVALLAAAVAFRRAGVGWPATLLVGLSAPVCPSIRRRSVPLALVCFAAGAVLIERWRAREMRAVAVSSTNFRPGIRDCRWVEEDRYDVRSQGTVSARPELGR